MIITDMKLSLSIMFNDGYKIWSGYNYSYFRRLEFIEHQYCFMIFAPVTCIRRGFTAQFNCFLEEFDTHQSTMAGVLVKCNSF